MNRPEDQDEAAPFLYAKKELGQESDADCTRTSPEKDARTMTVTEVARENRDAD